MSPVSYIPGFSDFFATLARVKAPNVDGVFDDPVKINSMFAQAKNDFNARMLRFAVDWAIVEPVAPGQPGHAFHYETYNSLAGLAWVHGFQVLPHVVNAPDWAKPPFDEENPNRYRGYPREDKLPEFGSFVAETLSYFAQVVPGICRAVEVCNEPNGDKWRIEPEEYKLMLYAALEAVIARSYPFQPAYKPTVISGGLTCRPADEDDDGVADWEQYLAEILNQCPPVLPSGEFFHPAVGIHPYDTRNHSGPDPVGDFVDAVKGKWNAAKDIATAGNDIWITEFGCTAEQSYGFNEQDKHDAFEELLNANDGFFTTRSRCKAVLLYRYLPQSVKRDDTTSDYWDTVPMLDDDLLPKQPVADMLKTNWQNAPS